MDDCCAASFALKGLREGFTLTTFGDRHVCETCGQVWQLVRDPTDDTPTHAHYTWRPVTH